MTRRLLSSADLLFIVIIALALVAITTLLLVPAKLIPALEITTVILLLPGVLFVTMFRSDDLGERITLVIFLSCGAAYLSLYLTERLAKKFNPTNVVLTITVVNLVSLVFLLAYAMARKRLKKWALQSRHAPNFLPGINRKFYS